MKLWAVCAAIIFVCACGPRGPVPPLPTVNTSGFEDSVKAAVDRALRTAQAAPDDAAKVADLGIVLHAHDQFAAATQAYRRALALAPDASTSYYLGVALAADGKYAEALQPLTMALAGQPNDNAIQLKLAGALLATGDLERARAQYTTVAGRDPQSAAAHYGRGRTLTGNEATAAYRRALEIFPRYGAAQFALAAAYRRAGQATAADALLKDYERDKTLAPPQQDAALDRLAARSVSSTGLLRQAQGMEREGDLAGALALHEEAVKSNPKLDQAWVNLISLYARTGQPAKVDGVFNQAIALAPNRAEAYYNFGVFCVGAERWADAARAFEKALTLDPKNAEAAHNLGSLAARTGDLQRGATLFQKAIALKPDHRLAHFHLGQIYVSQRRYAEAAAEIAQAVEPLDAESPTYLYAWGAVEARAGKKQKAFDLLRRARTEAERWAQQTLVAAIDRDLAALARQ